MQLTKTQAYGEEVGQFTAHTLLDKSLEFNEVLLLIIYKKSTKNGGNGSVQRKDVKMPKLSKNL